MLFWLIWGLRLQFHQRGLLKVWYPQSLPSFEWGNGPLPLVFTCDLLDFNEAAKTPCDVTGSASGGRGPGVLRERQGKKTKECRHYFGVKTHLFLHIRLLFEGKCFIKQVQGFTVDIRECVNHVRNIRCGTSVYSKPPCLLDMSSRHPKFKDFLKHILEYFN